MDPDALWRVICDSLKMLNKDPENMEIREDAYDALNNLAEWLFNGGFPPTMED